MIHTIGKNADHIRGAEFSPGALSFHTQESFTIVRALNSDTAGVRDKSLASKGKVFVPDHPVPQ